MNTVTIQKIETEADQLHFEKALDMLETCRPQSGSDPDWNRLAARVKRGLFQGRQALTCAKRGGQDVPSRLELAKCLFACGEVHQAGLLLEELHRETDNPGCGLALAAWYGETGQVHKGRRLLQHMDPDSLSGLQRMDWLILAADLASFEEDTGEAFRLYKQALEDVKLCIPFNWQPLRRMLIFHNIADTREQMEEPDEALALYDSALKEMRLQKQRDDRVTDLSGYELELLLSLANCLGNAENFEAAHQRLQEAEALMQSVPPAQLSYFQARLLYISGLLAMNEEKNEEAVRYLEQALDLQEDLCARGRDKPEHAARCAYYLASVLPDARADRKLALYDRAWDVFDAVQEKEPSFYILAMADMENERGRLAVSGESAAVHYRKAASLYDSLIRSHPEDLLARRSRLTAWINLFLLDPRPEETDRIRQELSRLRQNDSGSLYLHTVVSWLLDNPRCPRKLHVWLENFRQHLDSPYGA